MTQSVIREKQVSWHEIIGLYRKGLIERRRDDLKKLLETDAYFECERCKGTGHMRITKTYENGEFSWINNCQNCNGTGFFDWIEIIKGKK